MGNVFSRCSRGNKKNYEEECESKKGQEEVDFNKIAIETSTREQIYQAYKETRKNNLELYLNDVYEKECMFKIDQKEVNFIKTRIEKFVKKIVDRVVEDVSVCTSLSRYEQRCITPSSNCIFLDDSFLNIYISNDVNKILTKKCSLICVGSFYDGTKNSFPDEFDFIFPLFDCNRHTFPKVDDNLRGTLSDAFKKIADILKLPPHCEGHQVERELTYDKFLGMHGPAYKVQFKYDNGSGKTRFIHVDIVPAVRVFGMNRESWFVKTINSTVKPKTFHENVLPLRSCLIITDDLAFTEIEKKFMTSILSKKHVKINRILKYLINGHGDNEDLHRLDDCYCSYRIKVFMIYHHDICEHADCEDLAHCVLQVLEEIYRYKDIADFPSLTFSEYAFQTTIPDTLLSSLKSLIADLHEMQSSIDSYDYEKNKRKSVAKQYLDSKPTYDFIELISGRQCDNCEIL